MNNNTNIAYGKFFIMPQHPGDYEILQAVDRKTRYIMNSKYSCAIDYDWQCNTMTNAMIETIIAQLGLYLKQNLRGGVGVSFYDLFTATVTYKLDDAAEKQGNINIAFSPGKIVDDIVSEIYKPVDAQVNIDDAFTVGDKEEQEFYKGLDKHARYSLTKTHGIVVMGNSEYSICAIAYNFMLNLFIELGVRLSDQLKEDPEATEHLVTVNFNDLIEIHAVSLNNEVTFNMRPGVNAKLGIKSDELTEDTLGDLE